MPKDYKEFLLTLINDQPDKDWSKVLQSLWYDAKGKWHAAHDLVDGTPNETATWVHAYLHRKEGDAFNAEYWYRKAGRPFPKISLEEEFRKLVAFILSE